VSSPHYYTDRKYIQGLPPTSADFTYPTYTVLDRRNAFFTLAYSASPLMFYNLPDIGSKYPSAFVDADGDPFDGNKNYKLHLPANIPAKLFWSVTLYDPLLGVGLDNGQPSHRSTGWTSRRGMPTARSIFTSVRSRRGKARTGSLRSRTSLSS